MCVFLLDMAMAPHATQSTAAFMEAVTSLKFTPDEVTRVGERVNNIARAFNIRKGSREQTIPCRNG